MVNVWIYLVLFIIFFRVQCFALGAPYASMAFVYARKECMLRFMALYVNEIFKQGTIFPALEEVCFFFFFVCSCRKFLYSNCEEYLIETAVLKSEGYEIIVAISSNDFSTGRRSMHGCSMWRWVSLYKWHLFMSTRNNSCKWSLCK